MPSFRQRLENALELARNGNSEEALAALQNCLQEAVDANDKRWISLFARNAGLLAEQSGDSAAAEEAYRAALESDDADPTAHIALAELYGRSGQRALARQHVERAFALATMTGDQSIREIASILRAKYANPEQD